MEKRLKRRTTDSYKDHIPVREEQHRWCLGDEGSITIYVEQTGVFHKVTKKLLGRTRTEEVRLDKIGSYIWPLLDGQRSVQDLAKLSHEAFEGSEEEYTYEKVVRYMRDLEQNGLVAMR